MRDADPSIAEGLLLQVRADDFTLNETIVVEIKPGFSLDRQKIRDE